MSPAMLSGSTRRLTQALLLCTLGAIASAAGAAKGSPSKLVEALDAAASEEDGRSLLTPHMSDLKALEAAAVEKVVLRQWWDLARDLVSKSHEQKVDLSFAVRKAVRTLKDEADELLRTLNPKYGLAQQVSPAFQWAQNDTCIFLTIKYTVRWNAPGALEVTEPSVNMTANLFNFSGLGKHSNNKYRYFLSVSLFDNIDSDLSTWSAASVGKLSVTLRKRWARKWPRLLGDKKTKIGNMHVWMEMQEKLDSTLSGMSSASNSPVTCVNSGKLYCISTDTCKKPDSCSQCPGKSEPDEKVGQCAGKPSEKATLSFSDADMDESQLGGEVKIHKAKNDFDVNTYAVFWGKSDSAKLESEQGQEMLIGEANSIGSEPEVKIPQNTRLPDGATHLLVFSRNAYGEYSNPGSLLIRDAALPKAKPSGLQFTDEDGGQELVQGRVTILRAQNQDKISDYTLHWGRSPTKKTSSNSFISDVKKEDDKDVTHWISSQKPPEGAKYILAFSKNEFGDYPSPASVEIADATKPCLQRSEDSCPLKVEVTKDTDPDPEQAEATITITPAKSEEKISKYRIFWGTQECPEDGTDSAKNGHLLDVQVGDSMQVTLPADTPVPADSRFILVFASSGKLGDSDLCVSTPFSDYKVEDGKKEL
eukprot:TRINITY_DN1358_c1_g1_i1.p1 TRINITY_DN1358_c1_g1~~TRINITY_DN1358_c1_g1_i1.p1  ORF type:complete len:647 (+),score=138.53 TRINITY_DN1358_c1_g1_i1:67-2007(+)